MRKFIRIMEINSGKNGKIDLFWGGLGVEIGTVDIRDDTRII